MRKIPLAALLFYTVAPAVTIGQNIERESVAINFVRLPQKKLPDTTETYYVKVIEKNTSNNNTLGKYNSERIWLNGYYRLRDPSDADVIITSEVTRDLAYNGVTLQSDTYKYKKDKNSPEISYTAYWYNVSYNAPEVRYRIETGSRSKLEDGLVGGTVQIETFGSTSYENHYSSEYQLAAAWRESKSYKLANLEKQLYDQYFEYVPYYCSAWCLNSWRNSFNVKYVKEKKTNDYEDLRQAKDLFIQGVSYMENDSIYLINKLYQPDYQKRKDTISKAIAIWEKALTEADFKNRKARIDKKVGRHLYFNLALAYLLIDNFDKAQQYLQGREDDETKNPFLKNVFAGMKSLAAFIDDQKMRYEANKWRTLITTPVEAYVYKDPATRQREKQELLAAENERLALANKKITDKIVNSKNAKHAKPLAKSALSAKKASSAVATSKGIKPVKNSAIKTALVPENEDLAQQTIKADTINKVQKNFIKANKESNYTNINDIDTLITGRPWLITQYTTKNKNVALFKKDNVYVFFKDKRLNVYAVFKKNDLETSRLESKGSWKTFTQQSSILSLQVSATSNAGESLNGVGIFKNVSDSGFNIVTNNEQIAFHLLNTVPQYGDLALIKDDIEIPAIQKPSNFLPKLTVTDKPAIIYIYRPKAIFGMGKNTNYALYINEMPVGIIKDGDRIEYKLYSEGAADIAITINEGDNLGNVANNLSAVQNSGLASTSVGVAGLGYTAIQGAGIGIKAFSNKSQSITINNGEVLFFKIDSKFGSFNKVQNLQDGQKDFNDTKKLSGVIKKLEENIQNPIPRMSLYKEIEKQKTAQK